jgi:hypothetical protein
VVIGSALTMLRCERCRKRKVGIHRFYFCLIPCH